MNEKSFITDIYDAGFAKTPPIEISMGEHDSAQTDSFTERRILGSMCPKRDGAVF
jgi:hypothetical protein